MDTSKQQLEIAAILSPVLVEYGFVIAGGQAVKINGYSNRRTEDLDMFTNARDIEIQEITELAISTLEQHGYTAARVGPSQTSTFGRINVTDPAGIDVKVELAYDWREKTPRKSQWGMVLHPDDSAVAKLTALWARREVRDAIDVAGMITSGDYTETQLTTLLHDSDPGFELTSFLVALNAAATHDQDKYTLYEIPANKVTEIREVFTNWHQAITNTLNSQPPELPNHTTAQLPIEPTGNGNLPPSNSIGF